MKDRFSLYHAVLLLPLSTMVAAPLSAESDADKLSAKAASEGKTAAEIDWVPKYLLPEDYPLGHCEGAYIAPESESPEAELTPAESPLRSSADSTEIRGNNEATLSGDVFIEEGYRRLSADSATYNRETETMTLEGNLLLREPGILIRAEDAEINARDGSGSLGSADYVMHKQHLRGTAQTIERGADGRFHLRRASYTRCEPGNSTWALQGKHFVIDEAEGVGTAYNAKLEVKGVPVFYSPWLQFPLDDRRRTGVLWPSFSNTSSGGVDLAVPYYINLGPNYDATLTPRYISNRGFIAEAEARWLTKHGGFVAGGSYLNDEENTGDDRWLFSLQEEGKIAGKVRTRIDFNRVSDENFFNELSTRGLEVKRQTHLDQLAEMSYSLAGWNLNAKLQQFQTIESTILDQNQPYKLLPQIRLSRSTLGIPFMLQYGMDAEYTYFDHDERERGHRLYLEPSIAYPMEWLAGFIKPSLRLKHASYSTDNPAQANSDDEDDYTVPVFSLDSGLFFERPLKVNDSDYQQTLEPRLFYLNVPEQDQSDIPLFDTTPLTFGYSQLFREDRFTGRDRVGDADQLTLGVTTRFIDEEGVEKLSASLGQIFYFSDRVVRSGNMIRPEDSAATSAVAGELEYRPTDYLRLTSSMLWDTQEGKIDEGGFQFQYEPEEDILINVAYRYRRDNPFFNQANNVFGETIEQTDVSAVFPMGKHWRAYMRWQYDLEQHSTIEDLVGLEYSDCCWEIRLLYQRGLNGRADRIAQQPNQFEVRREHAIYLQFVLRGLGSFGDKIDRILDKSILGYQAFSKNFR